MSTVDTGPVLIAALGVLGTLVSPIVSQRLSAAARREEFVQAEKVRLAESLDAQAQRSIEERRGCYVRMNATSRRYRIALMNYLYATRTGPPDEARKRELVDTRHEYVLSVAEAQLTGPLAVIAAMEKVTHGLSWAYRSTMQLEEGNPDPEGSFAEVESFLLNLWDEWGPMRTAMRADLGVAD